MRTRLIHTAFAGLLALAGCAASNEYLYAPAAHAGGQASGFPAAVYPVPPEQPKGEVRIASFGPTEVRPTAESAPVHVLGVRMIVTNNSDDQPWTIDTRRAFVTLSGEGQSRPAFANSDGGDSLPMVTIARGQQRVIDLYYPLPAGMQSADRVPQFDLSWEVQTGTRAVAERTPFEREQIDRSYSADYPVGVRLGLGFAPYWWYDPFYPQFAFSHPVVIVAPRLARHRPFFIAQPRAWRFRR